jgi:lysozyme family protein
MADLRSIFNERFYPENYVPFTEPDHEGSFYPATFDPIFKRTKGFEGGFQNMKNDVGNYCEDRLIGTKFGISAIAVKSYTGKCPTVDQMKNLSPDLAYQIAKTKFWDKVKADKIKSQAVAHMIFDFTYGGNSGFLHTRQAINKVSGKKVVEETKKSPITEEEIVIINSLPEKKMFQALYDIRLKFYQNHSQASEFGKGWINRLNGLNAMYIDIVKDSLVKTTRKLFPIYLGVIAATTIGLIIYFTIKKK